VLLAASSAALFAARPMPVEIHVVGGDDQAPVAGATVTVTAESGEAFAANGTTDAAGLFALELVEPRRSFTIEVDHPAHRPYSQSVDLENRRPQRGRPLALTVILEPLAAVDHFNAGVELLRGNDLAAAKPKFEKAVELEPSMAPAWAILALITTDSGDHAAAVGHADRALALEPANALALRARYESLAALGRTEEADAALSTLYEQDKTKETARLLFNAGAEAANDAATEPARRRLGQALELDPQLWQAHAALAEIAIREDRLEDALAELDRAIAIAPRNFKAWERKIEVLRALGREDDAAAAEAHVAGLRQPG
jgi:tetratricopeptide (TPR) repeat protein